LLNWNEVEQLFVLASCNSEESPKVLVFQEKQPDLHTALKHSYSIISSNITETNLIFNLQYNTKDQDQLFYKNTLNKISQNLCFEISIKGPNYFALKLKDLESSHYEIPEIDPFPTDFLYSEAFNSSDTLFKIYYNKNPFSFQIIRKSTNETLFDIQDFDLIFSDKYLEMTSVLPKSDVFGLGERNHGFKLKVPGVYTLWNRDLFAEMDYGEGGKGTYGSHPLYLMHEKSGKFHAVFLKNSNAMDIELKNYETVDMQGITETATITYKIVGGVFDFRFFIDETAEKAIHLYHQYIGGHILPPFWAFGFHQSRYGFVNYNVVKELMNKFQEKNMPLDAVWFDIDYKQDYRAFTVDTNKFNPTEINHDFENVYHKKLVLIIDPGIAVKHGETAYEEGLKRDIFVKNSEGRPLLGCVWPGRVNFPDFLHPNIQDYWDDLTDNLYKKLKFHGLWIDMNEFSNFVDGTVHSVHSDEECVLNRHNQRYSSNEKCNYVSADYSVYLPGGKSLDHATICENAKHYNGQKEYDVHNFNGLFNAKITYQTLKNKLKMAQPFILTRSTAPGSGKYAIHWTGDNMSGYEWMKISIAGILNFNLFGMPFTGADICGFAGQANEELCIRWMQLGSVYPFFRNHNFQGSRDQDPFSFSQQMIDSSSVSIRFRYSFLKYFYSLFVRTHGFGIVMKPLFFEFPLEPECYDNDVIDEEFLLGNDILITPVLHPHEHQIHPYFPGKNDLWFSIESGEKYEGGSHHRISNGLLEPVPMFIKAGTIVYRQEINEKIRSTDDLDNKFYLAIGLKIKDNEMMDNYVANGFMMACEDYKDFEKLKPCLEGDCIMNVRGSLKEFGDHLQLLIIFEEPEKRKDEKLDKSTIMGIDLYGVLKNNLEIKGEAVALRICGHKGKDLAMEEVLVGVKNMDKILKLRFHRSVNVEPSDQILIQFKIVEEF